MITGPGNITTTNIPGSARQNEQTWVIKYRVYEYVLGKSIASNCATVYEQYLFAI